MRKNLAAKSLEKTQQAARGFFAPRPPPVPSTVSGPSRVHSTILGGNQNTLHLINQDVPTVSQPGCPVALHLLSSFRRRIDALPLAVGTAGDDHPLAQFSGDPVGCVGEDEDAWEKFDGPLNTILQKPREELGALCRLGDKGLDGFYRFLKYLVVHHGIQGGLLEGKLGRLIEAIDDQYVPIILSNQLDSKSGQIAHIRCII